MKTSISKKEIRHNLEAALMNEIEKIEGSQSSKKIKRVVRKVSKDVALKVKVDMKKKRRKGKALRDRKGMNGHLIASDGSMLEKGHTLTKGDTLK